MKAHCAECGLTAQDIQQLRTPEGLDFGAAGVLYGDADSVCCETCDSIFEEVL